MIFLQVFMMAYLLQRIMKILIQGNIHMLGIIRSGINVAQHELSLVSNNLANAKTTGFKRSAGRFEDQYSVALDGITPANGMGSNITKASRMHSQGALICRRC